VNARVELSLPAAFEDRLRGSDVVQVATLVFAALVVTLVTVWPSTSGASNESWYGFAQVRAVILALLALGFGSSAVAEGPRRGVATAAAVAIMALLTVPLEIAAFAATYPATPLWWPLASIVVLPLGYFAIGLGLGRVARLLRLGAFLPLLVPGVVIGLLLLDVQLGWTVLNPLTAALVVSPVHAAVGGVLACVTLGWAARRLRSAEPEVRS
jgi:hypothetical protein